MRLGLASPVGKYANSKFGPNIYNQRDHRQANEHSVSSILDIFDYKQPQTA